MGRGRALGGSPHFWGGGPRHIPTPIPRFNRNNNHTVTNKTSGRSLAMGRSGPFMKITSI